MAPRDDASTLPLRHASEIRQHGGCGQSRVFVSRTQLDAPAMASVSTAGKWKSIQNLRRGRVSSYLLDGAKSPAFRSNISFPRRIRLSRNIAQTNSTQQEIIPIRKGTSASANRAATYEELETFSMLSPAKIFVTFQPNTSTARRNVRCEKLLIARILEYEFSQKL
jgi:hypothetical protein